MIPSWTIHPNGAFDLTTPSFSLRNCFPALDHEPIHPVSLTIDRSEKSTSVRYNLITGSLVLTFLTTDTGLTLQSQLIGNTSAPHWVHPFASGRIENIHRFFRQGIGFSGPTGFIDLEFNDIPFAYESYLITGLLGKSGETLTISAHEHHRFLQKSHLENRLQHRQFRNREVDRNVAYFEAGFSTERIPLPSGELTLPDLHFRLGEKEYDTLHATAQEIAAATHARSTTRPCYHWCSWYDRGPFFTHADLIQFFDGLTTVKDPLQVVQIDFGYSAYGDWLVPNDRWPHGIQGAFDEIQKRGYKPGIWVGPFMVGSRSQLAQQHPDWLLKNLDGKPHADWEKYDGTAEDEETYVLDTSHPEAMKYLGEVFATLKKWGARFFKTDFLEWGYKDSTRFQRHTPGQTSAQYFCDSMRTIRTAIGDDSYWLACISYFPPMLGFADGMRVASDVGHVWNTHGGTGNDGVGGGIENMLQETHATQYFNNVFWQNDPDVTFLRDFHIGMNDTEIEALAFWNGILGGSVNTSDAIGSLPPRRLALWRFIQPQETPWTARLPFWAQRRPFYVAVRSYEKLNTWAVLILNPTRAKLTEHYLVKDLIGQKTAHFHAWGPSGAKSLGPKTELTEILPGHSANLYYASLDNSPPPPTLTLAGKHRLFKPILFGKAQ
jgi:hypothetical protein